MTVNLGLPELDRRKTGWIRIPGELDVPVTERVCSLLDTPAMQRLKRISQLGLVSHVYPGATHSRFEHCLGVYRLGCQVLGHLLATEAEFAEALDRRDASLFLLAALLHDVGHWPYCHPIEDLQLNWVPSHEVLARELICHGPLADLIEQQWEVAPDDVADFLSTPADDQPHWPRRVLSHVLNGPVDIDKMDYLQRDSLHAGVPYGRNFDIGRLISSLCVGDVSEPAAEGSGGSALAVTEKGKTAAEMMVFARYVMFSEVYWHPTVRSATAMLQRLVFDASQPGDAVRWLDQSDAEFASNMLESAAGKPCAKLAEALFGRVRRLYKRLIQYNYSEHPEVHSAVAGRPYEQLLAIAEKLADRLSRRGVPLSSNDILIDAPPVELEVQFRLNVRLDKASTTPRRELVSLGSVSPVVKSLATDQFDNYVKRVRVFVAPEPIQSLRHAGLDVTEELLRSAE